jgi:N-dimethylarginine dimethylaminohydrolase
MTPAARIGGGVLGGIVASALVALVVGVLGPSRTPREPLVAEDASGHLRRIAIHYVSGMDRRAMPVWDQLFAVLPGDIAIEVVVTDAADLGHFLALLRADGVPHLDRFHAVVTGQPLTTWSRDRMAALAGPGDGSVLAPPRIPTASAARAGDWSAPFALSHDVYDRPPTIASFVFEGGDLAASAHHVFADINLAGRNLGRGDATRAHLEAVLGRTFTQDVVWLGDSPGEVPEHHIMMYMVPLDDHRVLIGDVRRGMQLAAGTIPADDAVAVHAARFDRVAELLAARGFDVRRVPVVVLPGAGSYVTYTNALFDRDAAGPIVYLPTYDAPALDAEATRIYQQLGYRVVPIDVSSIYTLNGSLGCLVNVMARAPA